MDSSLESDDSTVDPSYIELEHSMKQEIDSQHFEDASSYHSNLPKAFCKSEVGSPCSSMLTAVSSNVFEKMPLIFNGNYFKVVKRIGDTDHQKKARGILAQCNFCATTKIIKGSLNITSNFIQHLKKRHRIKYEEYLKEKNDIGKSQRPMVVDRTSNSFNEKSTISEFDENILTFVIENTLPLSIVESPSFMALFRGTGLVTCTKKQMMNMLDTKYYGMMTRLSDTLTSVPYVCTTLNVWLCKRKYIFGYTCHWIDGTNYSRKSAALRFQSFGAEGAFENIRDALHRTNSAFGLGDDKIISTITDNDDNVVDAFKEFGLQDFYEFSDEDEQDLCEDDKAKILPDLSNIFQRYPPHHKCVIHDLFSLATTDFIDLLKLNSSLHQLHQISFKRCTEIWSKCTTPEKSEMAKTFVPFSLILPTSTDWYSMFDSIRCLLNNKDKLYNLCFFLETSNFTYAEIEYLEEYCRLMEPIAEAFKFLQIESQMLYGYFLPTLVTIKVKFDKLDLGSFKYLTELGLQMGNKLFERFQNFFEIREECIDAVVASVSCPIIKLKFVKALSQIAPNVSVEQIQSHFIDYAKEFRRDAETVNQQDSFQGSSTVHNFFDFGQCSNVSVKQEIDPLLHIRREFNRYLSDEDNSLSSLDRYPVVKNVFIKYNTTLPSYASVRRLFAYSGVTSSRRNLKMSSRHFERLVIMKANDVCF
ncbi:uncharacterized protein LOC129951844 [Eupeodes corollae]|uniref:uncharacterized protein LOC129951844 n=1 Tax=Eupeodes corollae TaxID=290404 RepID=UPI00248FD5D5|nr:uncharacterized protein LOC129951844 [Eupeodes corollae]